MYHDSGIFCQVIKLLLNWWCCLNTHRHLLHQMSGLMVKAYDICYTKNEFHSNYCGCTIMSVAYAGYHLYMLFIESRMFVASYSMHYFSKKRNMQSQTPSFSLWLIGPQGWLIGPQPWGPLSHSDLTWKIDYITWVIWSNTPIS